MKISGITHIGRRETNEDRYLIEGWGNGRVLLAVADGMGGHAAGERAAELVCGSLSEFDVGTSDPEEELTRRVRVANRAILEHVRRNEDLEGMGSTLTAAFITGEAVYWVSVGDSRLYLIRQGDMVQVTDDHTLPGLLLREGGIERRDARVHPLRNMLLSCVGREEFRMDTGSFRLNPGDVLLLSTDGLHDSVPEERIFSIMKSEADLESRLRDLVEAALSAKGRDNITIVVLESVR